MERVMESKKSKIILIALILLTMLSAYVPKITLAENSENEYVKLRTNWTSGTKEMDTISNRTVYALFNMQLSGGVVTGFRNMKIKAENFYENAEDAQKPVARIEIKPVAKSKEIVNGSTSSTVEFESPLSAGTDIAGDIGITVNTSTYNSFDPFTKKIKITLSGEYQDPISREITYVENIIEPQILTLNVTPEQKTTYFSSYLGLNERETKYGVRVLRNVIIENGRVVGWYGTNVIAEYSLRMYSEFYTQNQEVVIKLSRKNEDVNKLSVGYTVDWGQLVTDFGQPVKTTVGDEDVYTFTRGTESETFDKNNTFNLSNTVYHITVDYQTENTEENKNAETRTNIKLTALSKATGWKTVENAQGIQIEKIVIEDGAQDSSYPVLYSYTPGEHSWISVGYTPDSSSSLSANEIDEFVNNGNMELSFLASNKYTWGPDTSYEDGIIKSAVPVITYFSDDKKVKTLELSNNEMVLKSIKAGDILGDKTLDLYNGNNLIWQGKSNEEYVVPEGTNLKEFSVKLTNFIDKDYRGTIYAGYTAKYILSYEKLRQAGLSETEIRNIMTIIQGTTVEGSEWITGGDNARYILNDNDANKKSYLEMNLGEFDCQTTKENKTIKLSMYKNGEVIRDTNTIVKNVNPKIYVKLSDGFDYKISNVTMTPNPDITIKNSTLEIINNEKFICIECEGTYDSTRLGKIDITINISRKLKSNSLEKNQSITVYMLTDNENYYSQMRNEYEFEKGTTIPNTMYYTTKRYSIVKTDSVEIVASVYDSNNRLILRDVNEIKGTKEDGIKFKENTKVKYNTKIRNASEELSEISVLNRLPTAGNKSITNKELNLDSTMSLINLENIKVYTQSGKNEKQELASTDYTIGYSNDAEANQNTTYDSTYTGYTNGIADVKTIQIKLADTFKLRNGVNLIVEYEMTMPQEEGIAGATSLVSYKKGQATQTTVLEPAPIYVTTGNPNGIVNIQKKFEFLDVGEAPQGVLLSGIQFKLVDMLTEEVLITPGTTQEGIVATDVRGIAQFTEVPVGQYKIVEVSTIPGYKGIEDYNTVEIENGETQDFIAENKIIRSTVIVQKKWEDTNDQQGQVVFMLKSKDTANTYQVSQKTDEKTGIAIFRGVPNGTYELIENKGIYGWYADTEEIVVNAQSDEEEKTVEIENELGKGSLVITKTVPEGDSVHGLKFNITGTGYVRYTNKTGDDVQTDYSKSVIVGNDYTLDPNVDIEVSEDDKTATITLTNLYLGDYVVEEIDMPKIENTQIDRYAPVRRTIALKENGKEETLNLTNRWRQGYLKIEKTAKLKNGNNEYEDIGDLSEFKVRITGTSYYGTQIDKQVDIDIDGNSRAVVLEVGEYTITEVPVDGYTPYYTVEQNGVETQTVVAPTVKIEYGKTKTQKIYNEHTGVGYVKVVKTLEGITDAQKVIDAGIQFKVVGKNVAGGNVEEVININQIDIENDLAYGISGPISVGGEYQLEEVESTVPEYFESIEPVQVNLTTQATLQNPLVMNVENKRATGNLQMETETNPVGGPLTGIVYKVTEVEIKPDGSFEAVGESITVDGNNGTVTPSFAEIKNIKAGNYLVEQEKVPTGWIADTNQIVEVPSYGTGSAVFEITQERRIVDTQVTIGKVLLNKDLTQATQEDIQAARLNENESFEVKVTNVDTKQEYYTFISGAQKGKITGLLPGTYEIEEQYKPKYELSGCYRVVDEIVTNELDKGENEKYRFTIVSESSKIDLQIKNIINTDFPFGGQDLLDNYSKNIVEQQTNAPTKTIIYIVDENNEAIPGATFKLLNENNEEVVLGETGREFTTNNRKLVIKGLPVGNYTLVNTSVPEGYLRLPDMPITVFKQATRIARVEIQENIPRGALTLSTTYKTIDGETKYTSRSKYKIVNYETGELLKFTRTMTGDYVKSELSDATEEISLKSGTVEVTGIEVGTYDVGLVGVTLGFGMQKDIPERVQIVEGMKQNVNVEVAKNGIKQISAGYFNTMYLDINGGLWIFGENYFGEYGDTNISKTTKNNIPYKINFPEGVKIEKFSQDEFHVVALDTTGKVWTWGYRDQLSTKIECSGCGEADLSKPLCMSELEGNPLKIAYESGVKFIDVSASYTNTIALTSDGKIWVWGRMIPEPLSIMDIEGTEANDAYNNGIKATRLMKQTIYDITDGVYFIDSIDRLWKISGYSADLANIVSDDNLRVKYYLGCGIIDYDGNYVDCEGGNYAIQDKAIFNNRKIVNGTYYYVIDEIGEVWDISRLHWNGTTECISENINEAIIDVVYSSTGHTVMLSESGILYAFGRSYDGQCGIIGTSINEPYKINLDYTQHLDYNIKFEQITRDYAIDNYGKLWLISDSIYTNALGNNTPSYVKVQNVANEQFVKIKGTSSSTGGYPVLGLTKSGRIYSLGYGARMGEDHYIGAVDITPKFELEDGVEMIDIGVLGENQGACAIDSLFRVWIWDDSSLSPVCLSDDADESLYNVKICKIDSSYGAIFAIDMDGKLWICGKNYESGIPSYERYINGIDENIASPICVSETVGTKYNQLYKDNVKFIDISADGSNDDTVFMLDSNGKLWAPHYNMLPSYMGNWNKSLVCISDLEIYELHDKYKNIENYRIEKIKSLDYGNKVYIKDNQGDSYILSESGMEKLNIKDIKDVSSMGYIDGYGQIFRWGDTESLMLSPGYNPLYNVKIKNLISENCVETDTVKGEIYAINQNRVDFKSYGENYIEKYLGIEVVKSVKSYKNSYTGEVMMAAIDKDGKLWTVGKINNNLAPGTDETIPQCISNFEGTDFYNAYKNDTNFKIVDIVGDEDNILLLDNYGKLWTYGTNSPTNGNSANLYKLICISDIEETALNNKYKADENYRIVKIGINPYSITDNNNDTWVWGKNNNGKLGNGTTREIKTPYCITEKIGAKIQKMYDNDDNMFIIDENGYVWGSGSSGYGLLGNASSRYNPTKISNTINNIKDLWINRTYVIASDGNTIWIWGDSWINNMMTGDMTLTAKQEQPIELSTEFTIKEIINKNGMNVYGEEQQIEIIDTQGKVWMLGHRGYNYDAGRTRYLYIRPVCISDDESSVLYGKKIKESIITNRNDGKRILVDIEGNYYTYGATKNTEVSKYSEQFIVKIKNDINDICGDSLGKVIVDRKGNIAIDSEGKLYGFNGVDGLENINVNYGICITDREVSKDAYINSNKILINIPIKNKLKDIKIKQIINNQIVLDENNNYWYFPENGEAINITEKIDNEVNTLGGKEIVNVINDKYVITSENDIYYIGGEKPVYIMKNTQGIDIKQIHQNLEYYPMSSYYVVLDTSGKVWTCGDGRYGQLGNGSCNLVQEPICISDISGTDFNREYREDDNYKIVYLSVGYNSEYGNSIIALDSNGKIWTWGSNRYGQLGNDTTMYSTTPICISNIPHTEFKQAYENDENFRIEKILSNDTTVVALDNKGKVWTWGRNHYGQLGNGTTTEQKTPRCVSVIAESELSQLGSDFRAQEIAITSSYVAILGNNGNVYVAGSGFTKVFAAPAENKKQQVLDLFSTQDEKPIKISALSENLGSVSLTLNADGKLWVFGKPLSYLGYNTTDEVTEPVCLNEKSDLPLYQKQIVDIKLIRVRFLDANIGYVTKNIIIAKTSDGKLYEWGDGIESMQECTRFNEAVETIYGDTTADHIMECITACIGSLYDKKVTITKWLNLKKWIINYDCENNQVLSVEEDDSMFSEENSIEQVLDNTHIKLDNGRIYTITQTGDLEYYGKEYTPDTVEAEQQTILIPGVNIVSQTNCKALDDEGNLYVWNDYTGGLTNAFYVEPKCITTEEYIVKPVYSSGTGWTAIKQVF